MQTIEGRYSYRGIWQVAYPILISLIMEQLIGMTDTAFLGRVGEIELGASAIAGVYYMVIFMVGFGFAIGSQIIIGRKNGEGRYSETGKIFWHGIYFLLALAAVMVALSEALSPWLMSKIVSSELILDASLDYVRWRVIGLFFAFVTAMFRAFYIGTTQVRILTLNSIVMVLSNVVFNWILIFGHFGIPAFGIAGAAIGSTLAELVSLIFFLIYTARKTDRKKYGLEKAVKFEWAQLKSMLSLSVWTMIESFISVSTWLIFFLYVEHLGERSLAVSNLIRNMSGIIWVFLMAFSSTGSTLTSNMIGEGKQEQVLGLVKKISLMAYGVISIIMLIFVLFPKEVLAIFTDMPEIVLASIPALMVMTSSYLINIPANICFNAAMGTGNTKTVFVLEIIALAVYMIYCTIVITILKADIAVCWTAEYVYASMMLLLCGGYLYSGRWKTKRNGIDFFMSRREWIRKTLEKQRVQTQEKPAFSPEEILLMRSTAKKVLPGVLNTLAKKYGFEYNRLALKNNRSNWGSCSSKKNINLNIHLVRLPEELRDYVILHELCHLKYMNHGREFHNLLDKLCREHLSKSRTVLQKELRHFRLV